MFTRIYKTATNVTAVFAVRLIVWIGFLISLAKLKELVEPPYEKIMLTKAFDSW